MECKETYSLEELKKAIERVSQGEEKSLSVCGHPYGDHMDFVSQGFMAFLAVKPALCYVRLHSDDKIWILENNDDLMWLVENLKELGFYPIEEISKKEVGNE